MIFESKLDYENKIKFYKTDVIVPNNILLDNKWIFYATASRTENGVPNILYAKSGNFTISIPAFNMELLYGYKIKY